MLMAPDVFVPLSSAGLPRWRRAAAFAAAMPMLLLLIFFAPPLLDDAIRFLKRHTLFTRWLDAADYAIIFAMLYVFSPTYAAAIRRYYAATYAIMPPFCRAAAALAPSLIRC